jgi:hypothetical protein
VLNDSLETLPANQPTSQARPPVVKGFATRFGDQGKTATRLRSELPRERRPFPPQA